MESGRPVDMEKVEGAPESVGSVEVLEVMEVAAEVEPEPQKPSQSSQLPQEDNFSMSRSQDQNNSQVYGPRSPTGLSCIIPTCKVSDDRETSKAAPAAPAPTQSSGSGEDKEEDLLSDVLKKAAAEDCGAEESSRGSNPEAASERSFQYLEDAQRLIPSQDPVYFELQPPAKSPMGPPQSVILEPMLVSEFRVAQPGEELSSMTSSRRREELELLESPPGSYIPPYQLALEGSVAGTKREESPRPSPHKRFRPEEDRTFTLRGATAVGPPPGPLAFRLTGALGRVNYRSPVLEMTKNGESGFIPHDFPWVEPELAVDPDPTPEELGEDRFMKVKETSSGVVDRTVIRNNMVPFLMIVLDSEDQTYIPSTTFFDLAVNRMEAAVLVHHPKLRPVFWCCSKWMGCGVIEIEAGEYLEEWRAVLSGLTLDGGLKAETFPKDSLLMGQDVTALLKENYLTYDISMMNHCLVYRNKQLQGNVRVVCSKQYSPHDITRHAINMDGWQMIYLGGDCVFMESLSRFPVSHRFHVGPSSVVLRGGIRKPAFLSEQARAQFTWFKPNDTLVPSLGLQPVQGTSSTTLTRSSSSTSSSGQGGSSIKPKQMQATRKSKALLVKTMSEPAKAEAGLEEKVIDTVKSASQKSVQKPVVLKPKNRSARIKARQAKKSCC